MLDVDGNARSLGRRLRFRFRERNRLVLGRNTEGIESALLADDYSIDEQSGVAIWVQLRNRIVYLISSGKCRAGDKLPTVRELAVKFGVNYNTISKVYQSLERDGFIKTQRGKGAFVAEIGSEEDDPVGSAVYLADDFIGQCRRLGLSSEEILKLVEERLL